MRLSLIYRPWAKNSRSLRAIRSPARVPASSSKPILLAPFKKNNMKKITLISAFIAAALSLPAYTFASEESYGSGYLPTGQAGVAYPSYTSALMSIGNGSYDSYPASSGSPASTGRAAASSYPSNIGRPGYTGGPARTGYPVATGYPINLGYASRIGYAIPLGYATQLGYAIPLGYATTLG